MKLDSISRLLPAVFQQAIVEGTPLYSLLAVMEAMHVRTEQTLADLDVYFDPQRAPDEFIPMLAQWVDLGWLTGQTPATTDPGARESPARASVLSVERLRNLVNSAVELSRRRGTAAGLSEFLTHALGSSRFTLHENVDSAGQPRPFHLWIDVDESLQSDRPLIDRIVTTEKPAYLTHEITIAPAQPAL